MYTLNLYSAVCQLYLNETGREKKTPTSRNAVHMWYKHFEQYHLTALQNTRTNLYPHWQSVSSHLPIRSINIK